MSGSQPECRCKIYVDKSKFFVSPSTMSTSSKDHVSCDVIIAQQFHIKAVHRKAVRTKPWFLFHVQWRGSFDYICSFLSVFFHASHLCHSCCTRAVVFCSAWRSLSLYILPSLCCLHLNKPLWMPFTDRHRALEHESAILCAFLGQNEFEVVFLVKREDK